ncbi:MAG: hypothetical protein ACI8TX_000211 [Hyphomicrobiaceae bacterium]|jgi:hypothetical protein
MEFDREHFLNWMAIASVLFLAGTAIWLVFLIPKLIVSPDPD